MARKRTHMAGPMRVLHLIPSEFDPGATVTGGGERYATELARHMAEVVPTTLACFGPVDRAFRMGRLSVRILGHPWHVRGQRHNPISPRLIGLIARHDVIHCHQRHLLATSLSALAGRLMGRRVFVTDHGGGGWDVSHYFDTSRWFHAHLHVSEFSRDVAEQTHDPRAQVIWGGVDTMRFARDPRVPKDGSVLFVGRLLPHKGVDVLIRAIDEHTPLRIVGRPLDERYLRDLKEMIGSKRISFCHDLDDAGIVRAYRAARCVVLPSVYRTMYGQETRVPELLGQTLLEAMACGTAVVCTRVGGMPQVVEDGVCGLAVEPNDPQALGEAIRRVRDDPRLARDFGRAGRQRVLQRFTWPDVVRRCLEIYQLA